MIYLFIIVWFILVAPISLFYYFTALRFVFQPILMEQKILVPLIVALLLLVAWMLTIGGISVGLQLLFFPDVVPYYPKLSW